MAQKKPRNINEQRSYYQLRKLETLAKIGDLEASQELTAYHNRLVREANFRLRELNKAGINRYAYEKAQSFLHAAYGKNTRYKLNLKGDYETMRRQILSMQRFLSYETSTVEGAKLVEQKRIVAAREKWFKNRPDVSNKDIEDFLRMLGNEAIKRTLLEESLETDESLKMTSGKIVDLLRGKYRENPIEKIVEVFEKYRDTKGREALGLPVDDPFYYDDLMKFLGR